MDTISIIKSISTSLVANADNPKYNAEEVEYGLKIFFNSAGVIIFNVLISLLYGNIVSTCIVLAAFALLRFFSGGYHVKSSVLCVLLTTVMAQGIIIVHNNVEINETSSYIINAITLLIISIFAPFRIERQLKLKIDILLIFKLISLLIVLINAAFIHSDLLAITYLVQALTIIGKK